MKNIKRVLAVVMAIGMLVCCLVANTIAAEVPDLPTATATAIEKDGLTYAMNFKADSVSDAQLNYYGEWFADFELTFNKTVTFDANGGADGYLAGQYDGEWKDESWSWSGEWVNVPFKPVTLEANKPLKIMAYAAELLGEPGLKYTYKEVYEVVKDFNCGLYLTDEFLAANPDLEIKLELKMYNPQNEAQNYVIGETYYFAKTYDAYIVETGKKYETVSEATFAAVSGQTVRLLNNATSTTVVGVLDGVTLDLNGYTLTTDYLLSTGDVVDNSADNSGKLVARRIVLREDNNQLPINNADGSIKFYDVVRIQHATLAVEDKPDAIKYAFSPTFEAAANEALLNGGDVSGVNILVRVTWDRNDGTVGSQDFVYNDTWVKEFVNSYKPATGKYSAMFTLVIDNYKNYANLKYQAYVVSEYDPEFTIDKVTTKEVNLTDNSGSTAVVPSGTMLSGNTTTSELVLNVTDMEKSGSNIALEENEVQKSVDVHVNGVSKDNKVPLIVTVKKMAEAGLNNGNLKLYHVENGKTNLMTQVWSLAEVDKHNEFYYDPATGDVTMALATFSEIAVVSEEDAGWEGNYDYTWYNKDAKELFIANADQLAAFGRLVSGFDIEAGVILPDDGYDSFVGKTVKLLADINLDVDDADAENKKIFYPIGYYHEKENTDKPNLITYSSVASFEGVFDGNGHTVKNFYQNTWQMMGDYRDGYGADANHYKDAMGLFGYVVNGTVKNLTVDNFSSDGEFTPTGVIAAYSENSTFENIAITNCNPRVYNTGNGGIIGIAGRTNTGGQSIVLKNVTVDSSNKITALWGSWDVACGGLVGMFRGNEAGSTIHFENCHVAAQIDVNNDVCANYQYYAYRYAGMIIGSVRTNEVVDGKTLPLMDGITAKGCTVNYDKWNDYYYCELVANSIASYTHDYQFSRLTRVQAVNGTTITDLDGKEFTVPASGRYNYVVVTGEEGTNNATCYHFVDGKVHNHEDEGTQIIDGKEILVENNQHIYLPFNQLFTGYSWGVSNVGLSNHNGFDVSGISVGALETSKEKFEKAETAKDIYDRNSTVMLGELFAATASGIASEGGIDYSNVQVFVSPADDNSTASGSYVADTENWAEGTLTFKGYGMATVTITDYNFCKPTTITLRIADFGEGVLTNTGEKFSNGADIYEILDGNSGTIVLSEDLQDFALEFKYRDEFTEDINPYPLNVSMRGGKYELRIHEWASATPLEKSSTLRFIDRDSTADYGGNGHFKVADDVWTQFKIVVAEQRVAIFINGVRWYSANLTDEAVGGELKLVFSKANNRYISDLKVTEATAVDTYAVIDASFDSAIFNGFKSVKNVAGKELSYDATHDAMVISGHSDCSSNSFANGINNYEFETAVQYSGLSGEGGGLQVISPTGYTYKFLNDCIFVYNGTTRIKIIYFPKWNGDNLFHNIKVVYNNNVEMVYIDGVLKYTAELDEEKTGNFKLKYALQNSGSPVIYQKFIKFTVR